MAHQNNPGLDIRTRLERHVRRAAHPRGLLGLGGNSPPPPNQGLGGADTSTNRAAAPTPSPACVGFSPDSCNHIGGGGSSSDTTDPFPFTIPTSTPSTDVLPTSKTRSTLSSSTTSSTSTSSTSSSVVTTTSSTSALATTSSSLQSTSLLTVTTVPTSSIDTSTPSATPSADSSQSSSGPSAGTVVGAVAGGLAGIVLFSALIGFLFRRYKNRPDPYLANPFDRDEFRRQSQMLHDEMENDAVPVMGDLGGPASLSRNGTYMSSPGGAPYNYEGGPRPPTIFQSHMDAPAVTAAFMGPATYLGAGEGGAYPAFPPSAAFNPRSLSPAPQLPPFGAFSDASHQQQQQQQQQQMGPYAYLDRAPSNASHDSAAGYGYADLQRQGSGHSNTDTRPLSVLHEQDEAAARDSYPNPFDVNKPQDSAGAYGENQTAGRPDSGEVDRSGTPDLPNVQQTFFSGDGAAGDPQVHVRSPSPIIEAPASPLPASLVAGGHGGWDDHSEVLTTADAGKDASGDGSPSRMLSVRNVAGGDRNEQQQQQHQQRPMSTFTTASAADPDDAYGGVY